MKANIAPEYGDQAYLAYERLDQIISLLTETKPSRADETSRVVSLSAPPQTNAQGLDTSKVAITEEAFFTLLDSEMAKVERFTLEKVKDLRSKIDNMKYALGQKKEEWTVDTIKELRQKADVIANDFLRLEKYVNLNFMGIHKILKKHDKYLPNNPCKAFYVNRMHAQAWVRGDYSDVVVGLSSIYAALRSDENTKTENKDASQSFLRSTTKYWIKTEDVSRVKYAVLRHLPVFLQKTSSGESDSQFTNSVYLDNDQLELYHGRLDKTPGAIALRLRWYGSGDPKLVFVERKTHNEKWMGEVSVKERFVIDESEVHQVLNNTYPVAEKKKEMIAKGKSPKEADEWETLVTEILQVIASKQLVPTMRTQCMRTAFQIPFDATVRVSLDTNLCMISERGYDLQDMKVWHRDKEWVLAQNDLHRFPHAVLEIKLEMGGSNSTQPDWVTDLQNAGILYECHKFSKFTHGCAVMLPEDVQAVPYWIDDVSLRQAICDTGAERILSDEGTGPGATSIYNHLLPFGSSVENKAKTAVGRTRADKATAMQGATAGISFHVGDSALSERVEGFDDEDDIFHDEEEGDDDFCGWAFPFCSPRFNQQIDMTMLAPTSVQKIEPKIFFANERTMIHWLHHGVILSSVASGILAFSDRSGETWAEWYALALLPISLMFCIYGLHTFLWRSDRIKNRIPSRWDDPIGPLFLGGIVALVLIFNFCAKIYYVAKYEYDKKEEL